MEALSAPQRTPSQLAADPAFLGFPKGGLHQIAGIELNAPAASFDFQAIPQNFRHLRVVGHLRSTVASTFENFRITCNADVTEADYFYQAQQMANVTAGGGQVLGVIGARYGTLIQGANSPANIFSNLVIDIPNYNKPHAKTLNIEANVILALTSGNIFKRSLVLVWNKVDAIDRLLFENQSGGNFVAGSTMDIYGVMPGFM